MSSIILNANKENGKIHGFARDLTIAEYHENNQIFPLKFSVPITDDLGNFLTQENINAEIPIIGQLYQKNGTINDVDVILLTDNPEYEKEEVELKVPKTLFEVLTEMNSSVGVATTTQVVNDVITITVGNYNFKVNTKETYTNFFKEEIVKAYDSKKYNFKVIVDEKYFTDDIYTIRSFMDTGIYSNGEVTVSSIEE